MPSAPKDFREQEAFRCLFRLDEYRMTTQGQSVRKMDVIPGTGGRNHWMCKLLNPLRSSCLQLPSVFRYHLLPQTGTWVLSRQHKSQSNTTKRKEEKNPISTDSLKTNSPIPASRTGCTWKQHQQLKLARRLVWELCSRSLKGCGQVGGTSLCSGKGRRREGTGALLWCAGAGEHRGCKLAYFSLYILHDWFKKPDYG